MGKNTRRHQGESEAKLTHARLLECLYYDPGTGHFTAKLWRGPTSIGARVGSYDETGYRRICIDRRRYLEHRLAWFYVYGVWPKETIDHKDMTKDNNRIENLREASYQQNHQNRPGGNNSKSGLKGAHWNAERGHWQSYIKVGGRSIRLGKFETAREAHAAYVEAAKRYHG